MLSFGVIIYFMLSFDVINFWCYHLLLSFGVIIWCYHLFLCYHLMLSFLTVCKCYNFCVIIFPCTGWVLSFMLSFNVIIFVIISPLFSFSWKRDTLPERGLLRDEGYGTSLWFIIGLILSEKHWEEKVGGGVGKGGGDQDRPLCFHCWPSPGYYSAKGIVACDQAY